MKQKCQVVMLPTEKAIKDSIVKVIKLSIPETFQVTKQFGKGNEIGKLMKVGHVGKQLPNIFKPQHLYILSDEEIKENQYLFVNLVIRKYYKKVIEVTEAYYVCEDNELVSKELAKKIIATNNPELYLDPNNELRILTYGINKTFIETFIKLYNEGNVIKEVMVDYEESINEVNGKTISWLKLNPDNTIIISPVEKKMYSRKELKDAIKSIFNSPDLRNCLILYNDDSVGADANGIDEWFDKNYPE